MPVDEKNQSSALTSVSGETVQLYYLNSGVLTVDAGQAAGVAVIGQLAYNNIKNAIGSMDAVKGDTSLSFTSTALTTEVEIDWSAVESVDDQTLANRVVAITDSLSNGEYVVDYANGTIYGKKVSTATSLTSTSYKIRTYFEINALVSEAYNYVGVSWNAGTFTEVFTFKTGGSGGTTVATVTVVYTDATKAQLSNITKT
jgi:hypothetical protein